jgi:hypothetical protein
MVFSYIPILSYKGIVTGLAIRGLLIRNCPGPRAQFTRIGVLELMYLDKYHDDVFQALRLSRHPQEGPDAEGSKDRDQTIKVIEVI